MFNITNKNANYNSRFLWNTKYTVFKGNVHCEGLVKQNKTREEQDKLFQPQQQEEVKSQEEPSRFLPDWLGVKMNFSLLAKDFRQRSLRLN